jgi:Skp family chaperone for outer membrane proteins
MSSNLVGEIQKAVADQAKIGKYTVVLNSATAEVVVFSDTSTDITDLVLKQLKDGAPIDLNQQPTGLPLNISTNIP